MHSGAPHGLASPWRLCKSLEALAARPWRLALLQTVAALVAAGCCHRKGQGLGVMCLCPRVCFTTTGDGWSREAMAHLGLPSAPRAALPLPSTTQFPLPRVYLLGVRGDHAKAQQRHR